MPLTDVSNDRTIRRAALIAGLGLLGMIVLAPFANFYVLDRVIAAGDGAATLANVGRICKCNRLREQLRKETIFQIFTIWGLPKPGG